MYLLSMKEGLTIAMHDLTARGSSLNVHLGGGRVVTCTMHAGQAASAEERYEQDGRGAARIGEEWALERGAESEGHGWRKSVREMGDRHI